jgi:hypothetical protein
MDALGTPTIATAAMFVALIFLDLLRRDYELLPGHGFFGLISVFLMAVLCQHGYNMAAWGLLLFPFVILVIGWGIQATKPMSAIPAVAATYPTMSQSSCSKCRRTPCCCNRPKA